MRENHLSSYFLRPSSYMYDSNLSISHLEIDHVLSNHTGLDTHVFLGVFK